MICRIFLHLAWSTVNAQKSFRKSFVIKPILRLKVIRFTEENKVQPITFDQIRRFLLNYLLTLQQASRPEDHTNTMKTHSRTTHVQLSSTDVIPEPSSSGVTKTLGDGITLPHSGRSNQCRMNPSSKQYCVFYSEPHRYLDCSYTIEERRRF